LGKGQLNQADKPSATECGKRKADQDKRTEAKKQKQENWKIEKQKESLKETVVPYLR